MTPRALHAYIQKYKPLAVTEEQVAEWLELSCTVALRQALLNELDSVWIDLLTEDGAEMQAQLRGQYMQIDHLLDIHEKFANESKPATPEEINEVKNEMEDLSHGPRN